MTRLDSLLSKTTHLHNLANQIVTTALNDSVNFPNYSSPGQDADLERPAILSDNGLIQLTQLKNELGEMMNYYFNQKEQFTASLNAIAVRNAAAQQAVQDAVAVEAPQVDSVESLRERIERMAAGEQPVVEEQQAEVPVVIHQGNRPDNSGVLEMTEKLISENLGVRLPHEASGLPTALPVVELQPETPAALRPPENSVMRLLGANSPLLDIFMTSPWLPNGNGYVTVGTPGFKWYKGTNPMEKSLAERATLPTGFYSGEDVPGFVVLRMDNCILIWSAFQLDPSYMSVYMVGLSDADPDNIRWFKPSELAASHARQLITELLTAAEKYKAISVQG